MLMMNNKLKIKCFVEKTQKLTVCLRGASAEHKTPAVGRANYHQKYCYSILNISVVLIFLEYHSQCDISKQNIFISSVKLSVLTDVFGDQSLSRQRQVVIRGTAVFGSSSLA